MEQHTPHASVNVLTDVGRPVGVETATPTRYDIPVLAAPTLDTYGDPTIVEALLETSGELRLTSDGAFGPTTEDSFVGAWDGGTLVGAILVVRESPWDNAPDGPFVVGPAIDSECRHRGTATVLIAEAASRYKNWGFDSLTLRIDGRHSGTAELYDDPGLEETD